MMGEMTFLKTEIPRVGLAIQNQFSGEGGEVVRYRHRKPFLPAAKPSGPRAVRVVVGFRRGGKQFAFNTFFPTHNFVWGGIR